MVALTSNVHGMRGRADMGHIPPMPLWMAIIRIFQVILAIIVLALTAFAANVFNHTFAGFGMAWFTFIWTLLFMIYIGVTTAFVPAAYNMWAHLGLEIATAFWWLVTWALLASEASGWSTVSDTYYDPNTGLNISLDFYYPANWNSAVRSTKASAGLGALEWLLFIITLIMFGLLLRKHRVANNTGAAAAAPRGAPMTEMNPIPMSEPAPVQDPRYPGGQMA